MNFRNGCRLESFAGKRLAYRLATELYLLPCGRKHAALGLELIAIIVDLPKKLLVATVGVEQR